MANENNLKRFMADLEASEELRQKLDETVERIVKTETFASDGELMMAAAAELGYEISAADFERTAAEAEDLDDAELEGVAGGWNGLLDLREDEHGHDEWCLFVWHCYTAVLHTESYVSYVSCWKDYHCDALYHNG